MHGANLELVIGAVLAAISIVRLWRILLMLFFWAIIVMTILGLAAFVTSIRH